MNNESMSLKECIERSIQIFEEKGDKDVIFAESYIMRLCQVNYNQTCYIIAEMLKRELIEVDDVEGWTYTYKTRRRE
jgi:hypothetical protein